MRLSDFDFPFDPSLIADRPCEPRDQARLLVLHRGRSPSSHHHIADLPALLSEGDLLVLNDTKVVPARVEGRRRPGGGRIDLLFVRSVDGIRWEILAKGRLKPGQVIEFDQDAVGTVVERSAERTVLDVASRRPFSALLRDIGQMPLPPYIKRAPSDVDRVWYQTVYARREGAIAAPTAGLHFTNELLAELDRKGIGTVSITLHVGPGTFRPVECEDVHAHRLDAEWMEVTPEAATAVNDARRRGGRIVGVGTTVVRALETAAAADGSLEARRGESGLFVLPGYRFQVVNALLTNFHLPRTTLLMLVAAFTGTEPLRAAYEEAVRARYRFYSYGDAMLVL
jgi:S-adenosylmethionine:tRNA ribosyltransferase-isomerase